MDKIDTHVHLLYPDELCYPWVSDVPPLQGDFKIERYAQAAEGCDVVGKVFMEVDVAENQIADEVRMVERLAEDPSSGLLGMIAAARPESPRFNELLDACQSPLVKGVRRILHVQPDALSQDLGFRTNVRSLAQRELSFDICVLARQLPLAVELADACPQVSFILDHCGVPDIAGDDFDYWAANMTDLARRQNVVCKVSALPTYCASGDVNAETLRRWVEHTINAFGWQRVVWGGDWPVCTLNSSLRDWMTAVDAILAGESEDNLRALYADNARCVYRL